MNALARPSGPRTALGITGFVAILVGGILAIVDAGPLLRFDWALPEALIALLMGGLALVAAALTWRGQSDPGGVLGIVGAVVLLVLDQEMAGILCLVGGILALISTRIATLAPR